MKPKKNQSKFYFLFFYFIVSLFTANGQTVNNSLKLIWEDTQKADSIRFNAIKKFYEQNTLSQPDTVLQLTDFHFQLAEKSKINLKWLKL